MRKDKIAEMLELVGYFSDVNVTKATITFELTNDADDQPRLPKKARANKSRPVKADGKKSADKRAPKSMFEQRLWDRIESGQRLASAKYPTQVKFNAIVEMAAGRPWKEIAKEYDIHETTILGWRKNFVDQPF